MILYSHIEEDVLRGQVIEDTAVTSLFIKSSTVQITEFKIKIVFRGKRNMV